MRQWFPACLNLKENMTIGAKQEKVRQYYDGAFCTKNSSTLAGTALAPLSISEIRVCAHPSAYPTHSPNCCCVMPLDSLICFNSSFVIVFLIIFPLIEKQNFQRPNKVRQYLSFVVYLFILNKTFFKSAFRNVLH